MITNLAVTLNFDFPGVPDRLQFSVLGEVRQILMALDNDGGASETRSSEYMAFLPEASSAYLACHLPVVSKRLLSRASRRNLEQVMELSRESHCLEQNARIQYVDWHGCVARRYLSQAVALRQPDHRCC